MNREDVVFQSDGTQCAAWLYRPSSAVGSTPIVVMAHGFTGTRRDRIGPLAERFAEAGIAALAFDYRGFGDSGGEPKDAVDVEAQLNDWRAAIAFARGLEGIDPERVAVWGTSYGGGHAVSMAAEDDRLAAAIAQVPFVDGVRQFPRLKPATVTAMSMHATRDRVAASFGQPPHVIPAVAPAGEVGFITAPGAAEGWLRGVKVAERAPQGELRRYPIGQFDIYAGEAFEVAVKDQVEFLNAIVA